MLKQRQQTERSSSASMRELSPHDRRAEPRQPASGAVCLRPSSHMAERFEGQLLDTAASGFRVRHNRLTLASGELVHFEFARRSGLALAVWTRIVNGSAETGFHILSQPQT